MEKSAGEIVTDVKVCIDEIGLNDAEFLGSQDNEEMDTIIRSKIGEAFRFIVGNADWGLLEPDTVLTSATVGSDMVGRVSLPDNFLRVCYARFASWSLYLSDPIYWDDREYATLSDPYATGTWERPKLAMVLTPSRVLELYKAKDTQDTAEVGIVTDQTDEDSISIPSRLYPALIYYISGLTLLTYRDQHADSLFNQAMVLIGVNPSGTTS